MLYRVQHWLKKMKNLCNESGLWNLALIELYKQTFSNHLVKPHIPLLEWICNIWMVIFECYLINVFLFRIIFHRKYVNKKYQLSATNSHGARLIFLFLFELFMFWYSSCKIWEKSSNNFFNRDGRFTSFRRVIHTDSYFRGQVMGHYEKY